MIVDAVLIWIAPIKDIPDKGVLEGWEKALCILNVSRNRVEFDEIDDLNWMKFQMSEGLIEIWLFLKNVSQNMEGLVASLLRQNILMQWRFFIITNDRCEESDI